MTSTTTNTANEAQQQQKPRLRLLRDPALARRAAELWCASVPNEDIAAQLGVQLDDVAELARQGLPDVLAQRRAARGAS